ncbi:unnamed protein product [Zymoseptoria tritici ST99CH_3D1]|nr:unnamed protein product [Zymoseptoria tritici ST99CH_3D1]
MSQDDQAFEEFREALSSGDVDRIRQLYAAGRLDAEDVSEQLMQTPEDPVMLRCLLECGGDPNDISLRGVGSGEELRILAEFGFDIKSKGHLILYNFVEDQETLDWLLDRGVDINATETRIVDNGIPLAPSERDYSNKLLNQVAAAGNVQLFNHLVARGAEVSRSLALHYAASPAMISCLLDQHNMDIHADSDDLRDFYHDAKDSGTPLCSAIFHQNLPVVEELLNRGADPERCGKTGHPPLAKAVGDDFGFNRGLLPALRLLLDAGADKDYALTCSVLHGKVEAAQICLDAGADPVSALKTAHERKASIIEEMDFVNTSETEKDRERRNEAMIQLLKSWIDT